MTHNQNKVISMIRRNRDKMDTLDTQIYDRSLFWLDTGTSLISDGAKTV